MDARNSARLLTRKTKKEVKAMEAPLLLEQVLLDTYMTVYAPNIIALAKIMKGAIFDSNRLDNDYATMQNTLNTEIDAADKAHFAQLDYLINTRSQVFDSLADIRATHLLSGEGKWGVILKRLALPDPLKSLDSAQGKKVNKPSETDLLAKAELVEARVQFWIKYRWLRTPISIVLGLGIFLMVRKFITYSPWGY